MKIDGIDFEREKLIDMYRNMLRTKQFEEKFEELLISGLPTAWLHQARGQEATTAGSIAALRESDYVLPHLRGWGYYLCKGSDPKKILAELLLKKTGVGKGKTGTQFSDIAHRVLGKSGVIGAGIPIGTGAALSCKLEGKGDVVLIFFGDGGSNTGYAHEAMVMAGGWKLPCIYFCEDNAYMTSTRFSSVSATKDIADRAVGYGFPGVVVDGNDVLAVYRATSLAVERARNGLGSTLIDAKTYRWNPHSHGMRADDRPKEEVSEWMKNDPIMRFRLRLTEMAILGKKDFDGIEVEVKNEMEEAAKFAVDSPYPGREIAFEDVFAEQGG